jgi:HipA-like protein
MMKGLKRFWHRWVDQGSPAQVTPGSQAQFRLTWGDLTIGILHAKGGRWVFQYTDEFRHRQDLRPIVQFPDTDRTYESDELWPFFGLRIPSLRQPAVRTALAREHIDAKDKVQLLRRFGQRTVANPFELVEER